MLLFVSSSMSHNILTYHNIVLCMEFQMGLCFDNASVVVLNDQRQHICVGTVHRETVASGRLNSNINKKIFANDGDPQRQFPIVHSSILNHNNSNKSKNLQCVSSFPYSVFSVSYFFIQMISSWNH